MSGYFNLKIPVRNVSLDTAPKKHTTFDNAFVFHMLAISKTYHVHFMAPLELNHPFSPWTANIGEN